MSTEETTTTIPPCAQEPPPEDVFCGPINGPATVGEPAVRGEQVPVSTIEERCLDGTTEFGIMPCEMEVSVPEASVAVAPPPTVALTLPETGAALDIAIVAAVAVVTGGILMLIRRFAPADRDES